MRFLATLKRELFDLRCIIQLYTIFGHAQAKFSYYAIICFYGAFRNVTPRITENPLYIFCVAVELLSAHLDCSTTACVSLLPKNLDRDCLGSPCDCSGCIHDCFDWCHDHFALFHSRPSCSCFKLLPDHSDQHLDGALVPLVTHPSCEVDITVQGHSPEHSSCCLSSY